jgi:hypothetical protein
MILLRLLNGIKWLFFFSVLYKVSTLHSRRFTETSSFNLSQTERQRHRMRDREAEKERQRDRERMRENERE